MVEGQTQPNESEDEMRTFIDTGQTGRFQSALKNIVNLKSIGAGTNKLSKSVTIATAARRVSTG